MATQYIMYSASPDGSNMVSTPTAETIYRGIAYMPDSISTNPNLLNKTTNFVSFTGSNIDNQTVARWIIDKTYMQANKRYYFSIKYKVDTTAENPANSQIRNQTGDDYTSSFPVISPVVSGEFTRTLSNIWSETAFALLKNLYFRLDYVLPTTTVTPISAILCETQDAEWKPSPSDWLADKANYTWTNRNTTSTRYSTNIIGNGMTTDKQSNSKYVGLVSVPEDLYLHQNLLKDSAYYNGQSPRFTNLYSTNSRFETTILDGYKCTKVDIDATSVASFKGVYISDNLTNLYSQFQPNDDIVFSFMIKGNIKWSAETPSLEKSTQISVQNRKDSYPNWERVIWYGKKTELGGAFVFYTTDFGAYTFYLRDICVQKATEFTGYKIAPQEFVTNPYNYKWEPINKTVIMYSSNPDGSGMTSVQLSKSNYVGIATIPKAVYENANLLENADFLNGTSRWIGTNGSSLSVVNQLPNGLPAIPEIGTNAIENINKINFSGHTVQEIQTMYPGVYTLSASVLSKDVSSINITKWRLPQSGGYVEPETKTTNVAGQWVRSTLSVNLPVQDRYVFGIAGFGVNPNPISLYSWHPKLERGSSATEWTQSPDDWFADPKNYTWVPINNRAVRYSPNPNGSGLTVDRKWDSRYRGVGNIPLDLYSRENLYIGTKDFSGDKWINLSIYTNSSSYNGFVVKQRSLTYNGLCQNISVKEGETYTICGYLKTDVGAKFNCEYHCGTQNSESATAQTISTYKNGIVQSSRLGNDSNNEFSWMSYTFKIVKSGIIRPGFENTTTLPFYVCGLYLVKEGYSPDLIWKQAPEDWANTPLNLTWSALPDVLQPEQNGNIEGMFPLTNLRISNGIYYHLNVTKDTSLPYSREIPGWTYYTVLDCKFNNTLNAGNTNILLSQLEGLVIKRRKKGTFNWITLKEIKVNSPADLNIVYQDSFLPSGSEFQYALVPILNGNIEGEYVMNEIYSSFNGVFISDNETIFKLYNAVIYGGTTANTTKGMIQPIGRRYPIMVNNSEVNYKSGQISAQLLGYKFEKTRNIDRSDIVGQTENLTDFLNTNTAKVITDWNGNIYVSRVSSSPTIAYNSAYGNGITTVSFDWVEQGKYDNQEDMYENSLVDTRG